MSILEKWGLYHINRYLNVKRYLFAQVPLQQVTKVAILLSFIVGFLITLVVASADIIFFNDLNEVFHDPKLLLFFVLLNVGLVGIEFWLLFHIGFQVIARYIDSLQQSMSADEPMVDLQLKLSLVRAVIELNEPNVERFGLNPYRHFKKRYWIMIILYRVKVILSNFIAKLIARKLLSRMGLRAYAPLISTIITGWWDAWVQSRVLKEARFRIASRLYVVRLLTVLDSTVLGQEWLEVLIRLVAVRIESFGEYNLNLDYLIIGLDKRFDQAANQMDQLFDVQRLAQNYQALSALEQSKLNKIAGQLLAMKATKLSPQEQQILSLFDLDKATIEQNKLVFNQLFDYKIDDVIVEV